MGISNETTKEKDLQEIIKLRVDGASNTVNTLYDEHPNRGVSLICPFPALEVDVPIRFGKGGSGEMEEGALHRISVEEDPQTGLPRLRLSIRKNEERLAVEKESPRVADLNEDDEPAWADCDEFPLPEEFLERSRTRRRYKMASRAAWIAVIVLFVAGGFILERAGVIDLSAVRSRIAGFSLDETLSAPRSDALNEKTEQAKLLTVPALSEQKAEISEKKAPEPELEEPPQAAKPAPEIPHAPAAPSEAPPTALADAETAAQVRITEVAGLAGTPVVEEGLEAESGEIPSSEPKEETEGEPNQDENSVRVFLPTRWPVEYATGYRVRDPNGIVIDVPGGLVKREGWLESAKAHPMIRSIKAIQRETGARFIVYVNGTLPRFMTNPLAQGVALRLYHEDKESDPSEVALLYQ